MTREQMNSSPKQPYQTPTLNKHRRLTEVTEGITPVTVTGGGSGPVITPTPSTPA